MAVSKKVMERLRHSYKNYLDILVKQRDRDVSEADTVTLVKDLLSDMFGFDKYAEVTSEHSIRGTYCDLAVKLEGKLSLLIEVKAIGLQLAERHTKQAIDYAANQGIEWVVLTNAIEWHLYHVIFKKPIDQTLVCSFDLTQVNPKKECDIEKLNLLTKEGLLKGAVSEYRQRRDATNRYVLAAMLESDDVIAVLRRKIRRVSDVLVDADVILQVLRDEVIKRELLEGEKATVASRRVTRKGERTSRGDSSKNIDEDASDNHSTNPDSSVHRIAAKSKNPADC